MSAEVYQRCFRTFFSRPVLLDSFATLSGAARFYLPLGTGNFFCAGQVNMLLKQLKSDKAPALHSRVVWPCNLSNKGDEELEVSFRSKPRCFHSILVIESNRGTNSCLPSRSRLDRGTRNASILANIAF